MNVGAIQGFGTAHFYDEARADAVASVNASQDVTAKISEDNASVNKSGTCETCRNRRYQDGSNEGNVSYKAPTKISPEAAASSVRAHEQEHVGNAYAKAARNNGKVVSAYVAIHTSICPECGRCYVSGGTTTTTIKYNNESNPYQQQKMAIDADALTGARVDSDA